LVELVDAQGRSLYKEGDRGEIVLTGLKSWTTPLIRYRTGTFGVWGPSPCPSCGQASQTLEEMDEPPKEFLIDSEGHAVPFAALHFKEPLLCATEQFDYVQDAPGRLTLRLVPSNTWSQEFIEPLRRSMLARLGAAFTLEVAVVDHIAPAAVPLNQRVSVPHQGQSRASA